MHVTEEEGVCVRVSVCKCLTICGLFVSTLVSGVLLELRENTQLDEYCVVMPWCHILEMLYIQIGCTWTSEYS